MVEASYMTEDGLANLKKEGRSHAFVEAALAIEAGSSLSTISRIL